MKNANSAATAVALGLTAAAATTTGQAQEVRAHVSIGVTPPQPVVVVPAGSGGVFAGTRINIVPDQQGRVQQFGLSREWLNVVYIAGGQNGPDRVDVVSTHGPLPALGKTNLNSVHQSLEDFCRQSPADVCVGDKRQLLEKAFRDTPAEWSKGGAFHHIPDGAVSFYATAPSAAPAGAPVVSAPQTAPVAPPQTYPSQQQSYPQQAAPAQPAQPSSGRHFELPGFVKNPFAKPQNDQVNTSILRDPGGNTHNVQINYDRVILNYEKASDTAQLLKVPGTPPARAEENTRHIRDAVVQMCDVNPPRPFVLTDGGAKSEVSISSRTPGAYEVAQLCGPKRGIIDRALANPAVDMQPLPR